MKIINNDTGKVSRIFKCDMMYYKNFIHSVINDKDKIIYDPKRLENQIMLVVYLEDWINIVKSDNTGQITISRNVSDFKQLIEETEDIIDILKNISVDLLELERHSESFKSLVQLYKLFCEELNNIQLECLKRFPGRQSHTPKIFVPFSRSLNRVAINKLQIVNYDKETSNYYSQFYTLKDNINRINVINLKPKVQFLFLNISYLNDNFISLPDVWKYYDKKNMTPQGITRTDLISDVYNLYKVNKIEEDDTLYVNFPFIIPYLSDIKIEVEEIKNTEKLIFDKL